MKPQDPRSHGSARRPCYLPSPGPGLHRNALPGWCPATRPAGRLQRLADHLQITVLTADTFGSARAALAGLPLEVDIIRDGEEKAERVRSPGPEEIIAVGNGRNDLPMLRVAGLSVAVVGPEGAAGGLLHAADVVTRDVTDALDLVLHPLRLKATLRD